MTKDKTYYKEVFDDLFVNKYNYLKQDGEIIVQCDGIKEPAYWFISNHGRIFSVFNEKIIKPVAIAHTYNNKHDWFVNTKYKNKTANPRIHVLVAKYFLKSEFEGYDGDMDVHHITARENFGEWQCCEANTYKNLQILPKEVHKTVTAAKRGSLDAKIINAMNDPEVPILELTETEILQAILNHFAAGGTGYIVKEYEYGRTTAEPLKLEIESESQSSIPKQLR